MNLSTVSLGGRARRVAAAAVVVLAGLAPGAAAADGCESTGFFMPVKIVGKRVLATIHLNKFEALAVVDDSVATSRITDEATVRFKLVLHPLPGGSAGGDGARAAAIDFFNTKSPTRLPLTQLIVGGDDPGDGAVAVLGRDFLDATDTEYDLPHGMLRFLFADNTPACADAGMAYWAPGRMESTWLDLHEKPGEVAPPLRADVLLAGHATRALFSFAAPTMVTRHAARAAGVADPDLVADAPRRVAGRDVPAWLAPVKTLQLGNEPGNNNLLLATDAAIPDADMVVGFDFFIVHRIYVSKRQHRIFFSTVGEHPILERHLAHPSDGLDADALAARAEAAQRQGRWGAALADLDRACAMAPNRASLFATRAGVLDGLVDMRGALADYSTAVRLAPDNLDFHFARAMVLFNMQAQGAERDLTLRDLALLDKRLAPDDERRRSMAYIYRAFDLPAQELAQWNLWIPVHGAESAMLADRCWDRVQLGVDLPLAFKDCNDAIASEPQDLEAWTHRGWAWLRQGNPAKALPDFERGAARTWPNVAWALYGRAVAQQQLGHPGGVKADLVAARAQDRDIDARVRDAGLPVVASPVH